MILALMLATNLAAGPTPAVCENLKTLKLSNTTITTAEFVPTGVPAAGRGGAGAGAGGAARGQAPTGGAQTAPGARGPAPATAAAPPAPAGRGGPGTPAAGGQTGAARGQGAPAAAAGQGGRGGAPAAPALPVPAHCRVVAVLKPSPDSNINVEVWLPSDNWNGKFEAIGNGGWAGALQGIANGEMAAGVRLGYATAVTDTGHSAADGANGAFALGHPEKIIDFGYRAIHEMTVHAKALIKAYYEKTPKYSYFNGCSTGGRQALMEAQRYPEDFDGIIAGAPANNQIFLHAADMSRMTDIYKDPAGFLPQPKRTFLNQAVMAACDEIDGMKDGILANPQICKFDPAKLLCKGNDAADCLTASQVQTVKRAYADAKTSKGELVFPGFAFGGETAYTVLGGGTAPGALQIDTFKYLGHQDANWDWHTFDLDKDIALAEKNAGFINAVDPDLSKFKARGGKLLMYHGWTDPAIQPQNTVNYYSSVLAKMGKNQDGWLRLFMVPGMGHCSGGVGPSQFDKLTVLDKWRDSNSAPAQIIATHPQSGAKRPLCPYPQVAQFKGPFEPVLVEEKEEDGQNVHILFAADADDATNFVCKAP